MIRRILVAVGVVVSLSAWAAPPVDESAPEIKMSDMAMDMQGGKAPPGARGANDYADGLKTSHMSGMDMADALPISKVLLDKAEYVRSHSVDGAAWDLEAWYGPDFEKIWVRCEGRHASGQASEVSTEVTWWHATSPFWGRHLGIRADSGPGARTWAAVGYEGIAPYWFEVSANAYASANGQWGARFKASYDLLLTNWLILTPEAETNAYSRRDPDAKREAGFSDVDVSLRLRYEIRRELAPYIGYAWSRALGKTADLRRWSDEAVMESQVVAGVRIWL